MTITTKVVVLLQDKNKILLLKEWSNKKKGYFWNLIKGTFGDHDNETLEDCAKREAKEEAGVNIEIDNLISCYASSNDSMKIQFNFLAHLKDETLPTITNKQEQKSKGEDIVELKWFTKKNLSEMTSKEFINNRIYKVIADWDKNKKYSFVIIPEWN